MQDEYVEPSIDVFEGHKSTLLRLHVRLTIDCCDDIKYQGAYMQKQRET